MTFQCTTRDPAGNPVAGILIRATVLETGFSYPRSSDGGGYSDVAIIDASGQVQPGMHVMLEVLKQGYNVFTCQDYVITEHDQQIEITLEPADPDGNRAALLRLERGAQMITAGGARVLVRGTTAFPLLEMLAAGREDDVDNFLDWCEAHGVNWIRVFTMCVNLFALSPEIGRQHLPKLCQKAANRGIYVEAVAFADTNAPDETGEWTLPRYSEATLREHVTELGLIAIKETNLFIELCNEPMQQWQKFSCEQLREYAALLPVGIPFTLGAADGPHDESREYCHESTTLQNVHCDRTRSGWGNVRHVREQQSLSWEIDQYAGDDEPMNDYELTEAQLFALGAIEAVCQIGGTHHGPFGKEGRVPNDEEQRLFDYRRRGWDSVPTTFWGMFANYKWAPPNPINPVANCHLIDEDGRCYASTTGTEAFIVLSHANAPEFMDGWSGRLIDAVGEETSVWQAVAVTGGVTGYTTTRKRAQRVPLRGLAVHEHGRH